MSAAAHDTTITPMAVMHTDDLAQKLEASYQQHPSFRFGRNAWVLEPQLLDEFNAAYALVRTCGWQLARRELELSGKRCQDALRAVFARLAAQTGDAYEARFVSELQAECERLLQEELGFMAWPPAVRNVQFDDERARAAALAIQQQRHFIGALSRPVVEELLAVGADDVQRFREAARAGKLRREDLSVNSGNTARRIIAILNREFRALGVLDVVSAYMDRRMSVTGVALELSVSQAAWWASSYAELPRPPRTLYAHLDESVVCPKAIVYLCDVSADNGATSCYPGIFERLQPNPLQALVGRVLANVGNGAQSPLREYYAKQYHQSMSSRQFREHFMRLPASIRFNSHFGWDVAPDSEVEQTLAVAERTVIGAAGTFLVFDGARLLHRGGLVRQGERITLQVVFSDITLARRVAARVRRVLA
jgi:hypothetical protein